MRGFKLYAIIVAISCLTLQEASCKKSKPYEKTESDEEDELYGERSKSVQEPEPEEQTGEPYNCDEYKSNIWDKAFSSQEAMSLVDDTLATAKVLGTDKVCSDTTRALFNFIDVIGTNEYAFYSMRMIYKMITVIIRDTNTSSKIYKETQKVISQIIKEPAIRELTLSVIRPLQMVKDPVIMKRAIRTFKAIGKMAKSPKTEAKTKPSLSRSSSIKKNPKSRSK